MPKAIVDLSMSLDGFVTAANIRPEEPMGDNGQRLHAWAHQSTDEGDREVSARDVAMNGAFICGRRTFDTSLPWWKSDGPTGTARLPLFVVTHSEPDTVPDNGVYRFVTDGIESALDQAKEAAGDKDVRVMGGAEIAQQYLTAGLIDEIAIHLVPVLFGAGTRLFDHLGAQHTHLAPIEVIGTPDATHLRYRVLSPSRDA